MARPKEDQVEIAEEIQTLLLKEFRTRLKAGTATSTDLATVARLLRQNGWSLDPADLPDELRSHITREVSFDDDPVEDPIVS